MKAILAVFLLMSFLVGVSFADSAVWKNDHGYSVYIPKYWQCDNNIIFDWSCGSGYDHMLTLFYYDTKFTDPDLFNEREVSIMANEKISILSQNGKIVDKKSFNWFGTITQDYKVETDSMRHLYKFIVKNDGYVYYLLFSSPKRDFNEKESKLVMNSFKVLSAQEVRKLESEDMAKKQKQEEENKKKQAQILKEQLEREEKIKEIKKLEQEKAKKPLGKTEIQTTKVELLKKVKDWKVKLDILFKRFDNIKRHDKAYLETGFRYLEKSISDFEEKINTLTEKSTPNQIKQLVKNSETRIKSNYNFVLSEIERLEG
jgi:hypothetical protein